MKMLITAYRSGGIPYLLGMYFTPLEESDLKQLKKCMGVPGMERARVILLNIGQEDESQDGECVFVCGDRGRLLTRALDGTAKMRNFLAQIHAATNALLEDCEMSKDGAEENPRRCTGDRTSC